MNSSSESYQHQNFIPKKMVSSSALTEQEVPLDYGAVWRWTLPPDS